MLTVTSLPTHSITDVAAGRQAGLALDRSGRPRTPVQVIDLTEPATDLDIERALGHCRSSRAVLVGVAPAEIDERLTPLLESLTLTVAPVGPDVPRTVIPCADLDAALAELARVAAAAPQAAVAFAATLRQTEQLDVHAGLAAEASTYSMLLDGPEFAGWLEARGPARPPVPTDEEPVRLERTDDQIVVTLNRPQRRNAMNAALREGLIEGLSIAIADPELDVTLRGEGPDFCSGGDLDEFGTALNGPSAYLVRLDRHPGWLLHRLRQRATVQVHGACIGAGIEIPAFASHVLAEPTAFFVLPELTMGLIPGAGGTVSLPRRIGRWRTAWMGLTAAPIDIDTAAAWGLVNEVREL